MGFQQKGQQKAAAPEERKLGSEREGQSGPAKAEPAQRSDGSEPERPPTVQEDAAQQRRQPEKPSQAEGER